LGNITGYSSPKQVGSLTNWANVTGGTNFSLATKTDGTLWAWGKNTQGQLGLGNVTAYSSPKQVGALTSWLNVEAGALFTLGFKAP
jgi:alpha-tubulin suppressor-like RCC1 family protein